MILRIDHLLFALYLGGCVLIAVMLSKGAWFLATIAVAGALVAVVGIYARGTMFLSVLYALATTTAYREFLLEYRLEFFKLPLNYIELLLFAVLITACLKVLLFRRCIYLGKFGLPFLALALVAALGGMMGYLKGYDKYAWTQELRVPLLFVASYFSFLFIIKKVHTVWAVLWAIVLGASWSTSLQIYVFFTTGSRDIDISSFFGVFALGILLCGILLGWPLFSSKVVYPLILVNVLGVIVSFNRGDWFGMAVVGLFIFIFVSHKRRVRILWTVTVLVALFTFVGYSFPRLLPEHANFDLILHKRVEGLLNLPADRGYISRLEETKEGWRAYKEGSLWIGHGFGHRFYHYSVGQEKYVQTYYFHNSFLFYLVGSGLLGLSVILWTLGTMITIGLLYWLRFGARHNESIALLALAAGTCAISVESVVAGLVSDPLVMPFLGLVAAIESILAKELDLHSAKQ